ncbi:hypothetical protein LIER_15986 [Lithospermum erythrorhizon]|uniref:Uncharacterized protein n=1 Tax=Lithospermum erythrorhizon TaxID=34254 RepID=A0AAV3Q6J0_LITER
MLRHRDKLRHLIMVEIGDGMQTSFWHDHWHVKGVLAQVVSEEKKGCLRIGEKAKVVEVVAAGKWSKVRNFTREVEQIVQGIPGLHKGKKDKVI